MVGRLTAAVLVCVLAGCRGGDDCGVDECDPMPPSLLGVCGVLLPLRVLAEDSVSRDALDPAVTLWAPLVEGLSPDAPITIEDCRDGCQGVITVWRETLEPSALGDARIAQSPSGMVIACEIRVNAMWDETRDVIAHEIGHCLGLGHSCDEASVMHEPIMPGSTVTGPDKAAAWGDDCDP